jgi:hypothetical protein
MVDTLITAEAPDRPLTPWVHQALVRAHLIHRQMDAAQAVALASNVDGLRGFDATSPVSPYMQRLERFYAQELALARLLDQADLLVHAEGPGASEGSPSLGAVNWLCSVVEKQLRALAASVLPLLESAKRSAVRDLDLRMNGFAQGSLYAGFSLNALHTGGDDQARVEDESEASVLEALRNAIHTLPVVPQFVGTDKIDTPALAEAITDPALRDVALVAAASMAPTGRKGIHTLQISAPNGNDEEARRPQSLGQPERVVLKESLKQGVVLYRPKTGNFTGRLRALDLAGRAVLEDISDDISTLRCGLTPEQAMDAKSWLGLQVRVEGEYEVDKNGRPRLMRAHRILQPNRSINL